ncbi:hypothetical protein CAPTEDRAFT_90360 [Capitella teleta]|uniref:CTLH domain-containing protein n=1 Tax=Capitella teleta TaxID=283909 RepID=R7UJY5_CAPTE|nr:hypothetical protein CAPTEDRAFT_90360 [Capitella teleta]|eukprot:ELU03577.1 hypothetical protein CAPTEDRAFT_90360 [Capitella teleta]
MSFPFKETDVVKLILEFLQNRQLNISMLNLERESGLINGVYSDDMLFLRQLILDGQWDDILQFIQPLGELESFNMKQFQYIIYRHKYLELLCIKSETGPLQDYESLIDELVKCLSMLEQLCPNKEEYNKLTLLLTLGKLSESQDYHNWNPSNARVECFKDVFKLSEKFLPLDKRDSHGERMEMSKEDRLVQLVIKGVLFESCVEFCQNKATSNEYDAKAFKLSSVLDGYGFSDADLSLLSWLQAVPPEIFTCPFEQKTFNVDVQQLQKPSLEASWSEQIMITPIKPKMFPHSAIPNRRSSDLMSRSLNPQYDGLAFGLAGGRRENLTASVDFTNSGGSMSRSFAGFHLNAPNKNMMHASIDKLFEGQNMLHTQSSSIIFEDSVSELPEPPFNSKSPPPPAKPSESTSPASNNNHHEADEVRTSSNDLYVEYQKQRMRIEEQMAEQAKRELLRQQLQEDLRVDDNRLSEESDVSKGSVFDLDIDSLHCTSLRMVCLEMLAALFTENQSI